MTYGHVSHTQKRAPQRWCILSEARRAFIWHRSRQQEMSYTLSELFESRLWGRKKFTCKYKDVGVVGVWMPCRHTHALGFASLKSKRESLMRADPYLAPNRGTQVPLYRNFSSPRVSEAPPALLGARAHRRLGARALSEPTSWPTFQKVIRVVLRLYRDRRDTKVGNLSS